MFKIIKEIIKESILNNPLFIVICFFIITFSIFLPFIKHNSITLAEKVISIKINKIVVHDTVFVNKKENIKINKKYKISENGKNFIKNYEKLKLKAYKIKGEKYMTIGWGHYMMDGKQYTVISKSQAEDIFEDDIDKTEESMQRLLGDIDYNFSQGFIDGIGSLIFNCGESGVKNSEFYKRLKNCRIKNNKINDKDLKFTIASVKNMNILFEGHKQRRYEEHLQMLG